VENGTFFSVFLPIIGAELRLLVGWLVEMVLFLHLRDDERHWLVEMVLFLHLRDDDRHWLGMT
jgi:heme/copper-type cytochrome/quinol oxidase subunit 4